MYAVIAAGGKQHRVTEGETLKLEKIEAATGESIQFDNVLMIADGENFTIGAPTVSGAAVKAEVISHGRADKVKITAIEASGAKAAAKPKKAAKKATSEGDDLTRISGVGPVLVGKLNAMGITTFAQVAAFTPEDVARVDEELNFKGRIDRDNWIEQAKQFMQEG